MTLVIKRPYCEELAYSKPYILFENIQMEIINGTQTLDLAAIPDDESSD